MKTLSDTLWYLDPHVPKFEKRGIEFRGFENFRRFNDWRAQTKKKLRVFDSKYLYKFNYIV